MNDLYIFRNNNENESMAEMMMEGFEVNAKMTRIAYEEYVKVGFNDKQAFELTKIFVERGLEDDC